MHGLGLDVNQTCLFHPLLNLNRFNLIPNIVMLKGRSIMVCFQGWVMAVGVRVGVGALSGLLLTCHQTGYLT